ncbi:MAG: hypothetical protein J0I01_04620 [Stenotrophomonas nitritireducens]|uniref:hypothetical protein n=1 Tax=Stenotrophomonas nitritireducens TaxID=83617 RepID=UPI001ACDF0D3|nr:hypothetical protein [Stenotrophomonas nitritireducens]MBN8791495.1 hypothetical protein [Stenotrophomonas nitritireducens]MBN8795434.1 hypothetical protein [Stenotrophomonas nitritireducens]
MGTPSIAAEVPPARPALRMLAAALLLPLLAACGKASLDDAQQQAIAALGKQLPAPYRDGLVVESVHRHGDDLVLVIRSPDITRAMAKAKPEVFDALRADEQEAMHELCGEASLAPVYAAGGGVRRRFVDADGAVFFESALKASDCSSP